jgi:CRISPR/Cas system CSM-associated protein Csm3 (group 7 of RAMP superfamily)
MPECAHVARVTSTSVICGRKVRCLSAAVDLRPYLQLCQTINTSLPTSCWNIEKAINRLDRMAGVDDLFDIQRTLVNAQFQVDVANDVFVSMKQELTSLRTENEQLRSKVSKYQREGTSLGEETARLRATVKFTTSWPDNC